LLWRRQHTGPIGIDVGARCVRAVQLCERADGCAVLAAAVVELPKGGERDPAVLRATIGKMLTSHGFRGKNVTVALPSGALQIKTVRLPPMPEDELLAAGAFEARERFGDLHDAVLRVLPAGMAHRAGDDQHELIVLAARGDAVDAHLNVFTGLGLTVVAMEPGTQAFFRPFARFLERAEDAQRAHAFLDMGVRGSRIIIARGCEIAFLKNCPIGGEALDRAVAESLDMTVEQSASLRRRVLSPNAASDPQAEAATDAIGPVLDQLGKEISLCLRYYAVTFRGDRPQDLIGGGGEFAFSQVAHRLALATQLNVRVGAALRGIAGGERLGVATELGLPEWTTAVGLALYERKRARKDAKAA
jgi:Tfp pilus assembly PilM family ATPase